MRECHREHLQFIIEKCALDNVILSDDENRMLEVIRPGHIHRIWGHVKQSTKTRKAFDRAWQKLNLPTVRKGG